jgi:hypothetical protein
MVAAAPTEMSAWANVGAGGRKGGDYSVFPAGRKP